MPYTDTTHPKELVDNVRQLLRSADTPGPTRRRRPEHLARPTVVSLAEHQRAFPQVLARELAS